MTPFVDSNICNWFPVVAMTESLINDAEQTFEN